MSQTFLPSEGRCQLSRRQPSQAGFIEAMCDLRILAPGPSSILGSDQEAGIAALRVDRVVRRRVLVASVTKQENRSIL